MRDGSKIEKPYYNHDIEAELNQIIPKEKYKDFTVLLRDMFHRRAYEFGFSNQEILEEARNFTKNVDNIVFAPKEDMGSENAMGTYFPSEHTIRLNQDYYMNKEYKTRESDFSVAMYSTLVHEVYHAINDYSSDRKFLGLSYYDATQNAWVGSALNEVFTETAANRASHGKKIEDADRFRSETDGYGTITFSTNLLAAALGVTEKDMLKAGIQHRGKLEELVENQFGDRNFGNRANTYYLRNFEQALDTIYNVDYSKDKKITPKQQEMKKSLLISGLATLFDTTYRLANFQIAQDSQELSFEFAGMVDYRFRKIEKIMSDTMGQFATRYGFSKEEVDAVYQGVNEARMGLGNRVVGLNLLNREGNKITNPFERENQISLAKRGLSFSKDNLEILTQTYGMQMPGAIGYTGALDVTADMGYESHILKEDYDQGLVWDNESAGIVMRNIYREDMIRKGFRSRERYLMQDMPTAEMPVVEPGKEFDPDKTEELEIVDPDKTEELETVDPDKTEELEIVDPDKTEGKNKDNSQEEKVGFFKKIAKGIKDAIEELKNKMRPRLPEGKIDDEPIDKSGYYAAMAAKTAEPTFNDRYVLKDFKHIDLNDIKKQEDPEPEKGKGIELGD